ncbi:MAG TPA: type II secretion system F family protein [Caldithrix sp.]|nr:type II secretion system F family protein [Caldithrix sp.]
MSDFKFEGTTRNGKLVQGVISANHYLQAKKRIRQFASKHRLKILHVKKRKTFLYKIQRNDEKPISGEQKAFSKEEVRQALQKLGYRVLRIQPKLFDLNLRPPASEIVTFVRLSADLLREKLPFNEVLQLLINDIRNPTLRASIREINHDLRQGKDSEEAFLKQEKSFGKFSARMLGLASKSGNMSDIYESTARFLERQAEFKKNLRSALIMPLFTLLILFGAVIFYVTYIFPETAKLFLKLGSELPPMTRTTLQISDFLLDNMLLILLLTGAAGSGLIYFFRAAKGKFVRDKYILRIPIIGSLFQKTTIEIFCRVFYALYSGSGENVDAIKLAAEACGNRYFEEQIKTIAIPMMLSQGKGLVSSFEATGVFTKTALARFHSGAETGTVKKTALQIANYYEKETVYKLKNAIDFIQLGVAMIIMVIMTVLTLISSETALITPRTPIG